MSGVPRREPASRPSIRNCYEESGSDRFYREKGASYRNPHEPQLRRLLNEAAAAWPLDLSHVLDLAAGSGEVTLALRKRGASRIEAVDPFTFDAYARRTGQRAGLESFEDIAAGALAGRTYSLIVCSFAMHLVARSRLPGLALQLSFLSPALLILTPHKRPVIHAAWGWELTHEMVVERVRGRLYRGRQNAPS